MYLFNKNSSLGTFANVIGMVCRNGARNIIPIQVADNLESKNILLEDMVVSLQKDLDTHSEKYSKERKDYLNLIDKIEKEKKVKVGIIESLKSNKTKEYHDLKFQFQKKILDLEHQVQKQKNVISAKDSEISKLLVSIQTEVAEHTLLHKSLQKKISELEQQVQDQQNVIAAQEFEFRNLSNSIKKEESATGSGRTESKKKRNSGSKKGSADTTQIHSGASQIGVELVSEVSSTQPNNNSLQHQQSEEEKPIFESVNNSSEIFDLVGNEETIQQTNNNNNNTRNNNRCEEFIMSVNVALGLQVEKTKTRKSIKEMSGVNFLEKSLAKKRAITKKRVEIRKNRLAGYYKEQMDSYYGNPFAVLMVDQQPIQLSSPSLSPVTPQESNSTAVNEFDQALNQVQTQLQQLNINVRVSHRQQVLPMYYFQREPQPLQRPEYKPNQEDVQNLLNLQRRFEEHYWGLRHGDDCHGGYNTIVHVPSQMAEEFIDFYLLGAMERYKVLESFRPDEDTERGMLKLLKNDRVYKLSDFNGESIIALLREGPTIRDFKFGIVRKEIIERINFAIPNVIEGPRFL
ncbi:hook family protein [Tieghemostelium lacteum]|uniref:Hook family protein n=1 Tax=Tieghemostelium lacteum TaxID=361077 RepID=A0A151ZHU6_TIELA|nr:hook family protein [Tieghemostelium lacteum]|eukprot:KYQ93469.1 hook family protein [Tieghemostelium lacteum]